MTVGRGKREELMKPLSHFVIAISFLLLVTAATPTVSGQVERLGTVKFSPPKGWTTTRKENVVAFSTQDQAAGRFCIITLYGATPGTGNAQGDFAREWNGIVVKTMAASANPTIETQSSDGWTIIAGGSEVEFEMSKAIAFLTVVSGFGRTISVLSVFNDPVFVNQVDTFIKSIDLDKPAEPVTPATEPPSTQNGKVFIPMPSRQLTVADLEGEWGETAGFSTTYVDRYTGAYAGTDSLHFRNKMTITRNGGFVSDFFAIQNGKKIIDKTTGTVSINGRTLSIRQNNTAKYVIRGWLELADMTILTVCGPWYDDDVIPEAIFTSNEQGANLNANWIRKK